MSNKSIIVALDTTSLKKTKKIISKLDPNKCMMKVGSVLFNAQGRPALDLVASAGFEIFFDIKFHDIPNTVNKSIKSFQGYPIKFFTVHLGGGKTMLRASVEASKLINAKCIGVSLLTSLTGEEVHTVFKRSIENTVSDMFKLAEQSSCDGVVCSPLELNLATKIIPNLIKITPGIRPYQNYTDDQVRTLSAKDALTQGASYLVIGRPITEAKNISETFEALYQSIYEQEND
jgi:orotidine-5'-phosphate decarboxylase